MRPPDGCCAAWHTGRTAHWGRSLRPVWVLIGPGLSDPGHIEIHSRTIYLDSDALLGTRQEITTGRLERRAVLRCFGVALHETFHAKHTKRWAIEHDIKLADSDDPDDRQLAVDRRLLEEPRMEAHGVREHPVGTLRGRFVRHALRAAVTDVILPAFARELLATAMAGIPLTREMAGRAAVYLQARTHYGILDPTVLDGLRDTWPQVLGDRDLDALDELSAKLVWIADGELEALDRAAREGQLEQLDTDLDLQQVLADATADPGRGSSSRSGRGTGMPTGRMPDRGVDRPPAPDEIQHARRYATRLRQALAHGTRRIDKRTPGGRFDGRAYTRGQAQRQTGRPSPPIRGGSPGRSPRRSMSRT